MTSDKLFIKREDVQKVESILIQAIKTSDIEVLDRLLHNDLLFITPNGQTITKEMDLNSHKSGTMVIESILPTIEIINLIGDVAVVTTLIDTKGKIMEQPIEGKFRYIRVWKLFENDLKVIGGSCTQI